MPTFKIDVAMDVRAYGFIEVDAADIDAAVKLATPDFIKDNFDSHGYGSDDFDYSDPRDIWLGDFECEETGEQGFVEKDLPNSHIHNGLAHDAGPELLAALKELVRCVRGGDETAGVSMDDALMDADDVIAKAVSDPCPAASES